MADDYDDKENQASWYFQSQRTAHACLMDEIDELAELLRADPNIDPEILDSYGEVSECSGEKVATMLNNIQSQGQPEGAPIPDEHQQRCSVEPILPPMTKDQTMSNNDTGKAILESSVQELNVSSTFKQNRTHDVLHGLAKEHHIMLDADDQQVHIIADNHTMSTNIDKTIKEVETTGLDCTDSNKDKEQVQNLSKDEKVEYLPTVQPTHGDVNLTKGSEESIPTNVTIPEVQEGKHEKDQAVQRQNIALPRAEIDSDVIAETIDISDTDDSDENPENLPVQETQDLPVEEVDTISLDTTLSYEDTNGNDEGAQTDTSMRHILITPNDLLESGASTDVQTIFENTPDLNTDLQFDSHQVDLEKENLEPEVDKPIDSEMITEKEDLHSEDDQKPNSWTEKSLSLASDINLSGEDLESVYNHESGDLAAQVRFKSPVRVQINSDDEFELFQGTLLTGWKADLAMDVDISEVVDEHISEGASGNNDLKPPHDHKLNPEDSKTPKNADLSTKNENQNHSGKTKEPSSTDLHLSVGIDQEPLLDLNLSADDFINEVLAFENVMGDDEDQVSVVLKDLDLSMNVDTVLGDEDEKINFDSSLNDLNLSPEGLTDRTVTPEFVNGKSEGLEAFHDHDYAALSVQLQSTSSANVQITSEDLSPTLIEKENPANTNLTSQDANRKNNDEEPLPLGSDSLLMDIDTFLEDKDEKINLKSSSADLNLSAEGVADKDVRSEAGNGKNEDPELLPNHESVASSSEDVDPGLEENRRPENADLTLQDAREVNKDQEPLLATIDLPMDVDIISEEEDEKVNLGSFSVDLNLPTEAIADKDVTPQAGNEKNEDLKPLPNHELAVASSSNTQFTSDLDSNLEEKESSVNADLTSQDASGENKDQEPLLLATIDLPMDVDIIPEEEDKKTNLGSSVDLNVSTEALANKNVPESGNGKNEDNCESANIANTLEDVDPNLTGKESSSNVDLTSQDAVEENEQVEPHAARDLSMDTASSADLSQNTTSTDLKSSSSEDFFQGMISEDTSSADPRSSSSEDLPPADTHQDLKRSHDDENLKNLPQEEVSSADLKTSSTEDMPQTDAQDLELSHNNEKQKDISETCSDEVDPLEIHLAEIRATDFGSIQVQPNKAPKHDSKGPSRKSAKVSSLNMDQVAIQNQAQDDGITKGQEKPKPDDHFVCVPMNQESTSKDFSDQGASEGLSIIPDFDKNLPVIRLRDQSELLHTDFNFFKFERKCKKCGKSIVGNEMYLSWGSNEFCNEICLLNFQKGIGSECVRCKKKVTAVNLGKYCLRFYSDLQQFCGAECLTEYKKGLNLCASCQNIVPETQDIILMMTEMGKVQQICLECDDKNKQSSSLESGSASRKCSACAQNKPITITYEHDNQNVPFCSEACFMAYGFVNRTKMDKCSICKKYFDIKILQQNSMHYENLIRVFCSNRCQSTYLISTRKIVPCKWCKATKYNFDMIKCHLQNEVITTCSTSCLSLYQISQKLAKSPKIKCDYCQQKIKPTYHLTMSDGRMHSFCSRACVTEFQKQFPSVTSREPVTVRPAIGPQTSPIILNPVPFVMSSQIKPIIKQKQQYIIKQAPKPMQKNKMTMCSINKRDVEVQMKPISVNKCVQTDAVPPNIIALPVPIYVPMPLFMYSMPYPVPVPFALPIPVPIFIPTTRDQYKAVVKDLQTLPKNPLEAEIVMMAKMIADTGDKETTPKCMQPPETDAKSDHLLSIDWEKIEAMDLSCSNLQELAPPEKKKSVNEPKPSTSGTRKRSKRQAKGPPRKQLCRDAKKVAQPVPELEEKSLKYTHSVSTWMKWITHKNLDLERSHPQSKPLNPDLLELTPHELNNLLCTFINEIKKPTGQDYTPDIIYYLCLGIQMYLNINGRKDNIFCDPYYERFVTCLDEIVKIFPDTYSDTNYIVTRVEEEHLWESKQLGAHSPYVLLNTLIFFNTKYFNLKTINNHLQIAFATVMKHWKPATKSTGKQPKRVLLRYYPNRKTSDGAQDRKIYEQHENIQNPLRCPIKLYDFYLSKCPESVKSRADVFYLQPERSCVPESPVWFSVNPMPTHVIAKTLNRVKLVKEINIAFLNDAQS